MSHNDIVDHMNGNTALHDREYWQWTISIGPWDISTAIMTISGIFYTTTHRKLIADKAHIWLPN